MLRLPLPDGEVVADPAEVLQLLADNFRHLAAQLEILHIVKDQIQRRPSRLLLAVGVIDEHFVEMGVDLPQPAIVGG